MDTSFFSSIEYEWLGSFYALAGVVAITVIGKFLLLRIPAMKQTQQLNKEVAAQRNAKGYYPPVQKRSKTWGFVTLAVIFTLVLPFCVTLEAQAWWKLPLNIFVILMVYDFFYYFTHRFLFHNNGPFGGPLVWVHAVHHQQKNPCREDSSYLHPLEPMIGLGLYAGTIALLAAILGDFHWATLAITIVAFSEINLHNHDRMEVDRFPFKYLNHAARMHHVHHSRFTSGNYATISLFYDWLFGTYDTGNGYKKK